MHVIGCQLDIVWEDKAANFGRVEHLLAAAPVPPASLIILPEMFATGFSMNVEHIQEPVPSQTEVFLSELARQYHALTLAGLVAPAPDGRGYNEAVAHDASGQLLARYRKIHPFTFGGESEHYAAGTQLSQFLWSDATVVPFICYDLRFPEIFRWGVRSGANVFVVIANWPAKRLNHWITLLRARAIENQAYVIGVNRCGNDPKLAYPGRSLAVDFQGEILADAGEVEGRLEADLDMAALREWRRQFPALQDARSEFLGGPAGRL